MGRASFGVSLLSGAEKKKKKQKLKNKTKRCRRTNLCTAFSISIYKVRSAKSEAILRQTNCRHKCVGTGALESPTSKRLGLDLSRMKRSRQCYKFLRQTLCKKNTNDIVTETSISGTSHFCKAEIAPLPYNWSVRKSGKISQKNTLNQNPACFLITNFRTRSLSKVRSLS